MRVGLVHFGELTAGSQQIIHALIDFTSKEEIQLEGLEWDRQVSEVEFKPLNKKILEDNSSKVVLSNFPRNIMENEQDKLISIFDQFDSIILMGGKERNAGNISIQAKSNILFVPVSFLNDNEGSELSLGYDTALNIVVNSILKIRDTISSLLYMKPRVFCVQIPGDSYSPLLENSALAIDGIVIDDLHKVNWKNLLHKIKTRYSDGITYTFIVVNEAVDPNVISERLSTELDMDYKWNQIDESQCLGPYPSAIDRVLAVKLKEEIISWLKENGKTGKLLIQRNEVVRETN